MQGVQGLAGYILLPKKHTIAFVILENGLGPTIKTNTNSSFSALFLKALIENIKDQKVAMKLKNSL